MIQRLEQIIPTRLRSYLTLHVVGGLAACVISLLVFGNLVDGVSENESIVQFDLALANALHTAATPTSTAFFIAVSLFGGIILTGWTIAVGVLLAVQRRWLALLIWVVTIGGGQILNTLLKALFARPRPTFASPLVIEQFYSFPSGHAMMSFIAYGMLAYVLVISLRNHYLRLIIVLGAGVTVALIGLSRMTLGVHYFSDVIAGYAVGTLWLVTCITAWRYVQQRRATPTA